MKFPLVRVGEIAIPLSEIPLPSPSLTRLPPPTGPKNEGGFQTPALLLTQLLCAPLVHPSGG